MEHGKQLLQILDLMGKLSASDKQIQDSRRDPTDKKKWLSNYDYHKTREQVVEARKLLVDTANLDLSGLILYSSGTTSRYDDYRDLYIKTSSDTPNILLYKFKNRDFNLIDLIFERRENPPVRYSPY